MSINRGQDKGDIVNICSGILLSHYKSRENFFVCGRHLYGIRSAKKKIFGVLCSLMSLYMSTHVIIHVFPHVILQILQLVIMWENCYPILCLKQSEVYSKSILDHFHKISFLQKSNLCCPHTV